MGRQRGQTTRQERELIIQHYKQGKSLKEIAKIVNRSHSTIQDVIARYKVSNSTENKRKTNGRKIFNDREERWIIRQVKKTPTISAPKLAVKAEEPTGKKAHAETIRIILRKHNYHGRVARNKPYVNKRNRGKRLKLLRI